MTSFGRQITLLAQRSPDATALVHVAPDGRDTTITWSELERRSNQVAHLLATRGVDQAPPEGHDPGGITAGGDRAAERSRALLRLLRDLEARRNRAPAAVGPAVVGARPPARAGEAQCGGRRLGRRAAGNGLDGRAVGLDGARRDRAARPGGRARAGTRHVGIHRRAQAHRRARTARRPRRWFRSGRPASSPTTRSNSS